MTPLPKEQKLPPGLVIEEERFVPRLVMTAQHQAVFNDVLKQWHNRELFAGLKKYGIQPLDRLLFYGPPGNGKTMACYWMARQLNIPMYRVLCNNLTGSCMGETAKAVSNVMTYLNDLRTPALCLWDEVEAIFIDRKNVSGQCDRETAAALTVFLQQLDRWKAATLIVMATNLPEQLDAALLSRVEMRLEFTGPTADQCTQMLAYWSELLHDHGGNEWSPALCASIRENPVTSFRELQQRIGYAARGWTAKKCK